MLAILPQPSPADRSPRIALPPRATSRGVPAATDSMEAMLDNLLERLRQPGDDEAWQRFVDLISPLLFAWTRRMRLSHSDAADLVQDVLTILVKELPNFRRDGQKNFRGWLKTVTWNRWRQRQRRRQAEFLDVEDPRLRELPHRQGSDAFWELEYRRQLATRALEVMRAEFQPATWKACWELIVSNRPAAEVAEELGMTRGAVYVAKSRVLARLRRELDGMME